MITARVCNGLFYYQLRKGGNIYIDISGPKSLVNIVLNALRPVGRGHDAN